jgi:hypothetical protein
MNKQKVILLIFLMAVLVGMGFLIFKSKGTSTSLPLIASFEDCANAGYPVMESYPRQCRTEAGELFFENIADDTHPINSQPIAAETGYVSGHVTIGPNCPVEIQGQPCETPPGAYKSREVLVYTSDEVTIRYRTHLDETGNYNISVAPGSYFIQISPAGIGPGEKKSATVKSGKTTVVNFDIDTGIR